MAEGSSGTAPMALTPSNSPTSTSTQPSKIFIPSPSSNYSALLDGNWDGMSSTSPTSTTSSIGSTSQSSVRRIRSTGLKIRGMQSDYYDEEQDVWRCRNCGWQYPNPSPRARQRRHHKKVCEGTLLKQRARGEDVALGDLEALEKEVVNFGAPEELINTLNQEPNHEGRRSSEAGLAQGSQREDEGGEVQPSSGPDASELGAEDDNVEEGKEHDKIEDSHLDGKEDEQSQGGNGHGELQPTSGQDGVELGAEDSKLEERKEAEKVEESHLEGKEDEQIQGGNVHELGAEDEQMEEAATENEPHQFGPDVPEDDPKTENLEDFQPGNNKSIASPIGRDQNGIDHEQLDPSDDYDTRASESSEVSEAGKQINVLGDSEHNMLQKGEDEKVGNASDKTQPQQSMSEIPEDLEDQDQHHGPFKTCNLEEVDPLNDHSTTSLNRFGHAETRDYPVVVGPDGLNHGVEAVGKDLNLGVGEIASDLVLPKDPYDDKVVQGSVGVIDKASRETDNPQPNRSGDAVSNFIVLSPLWRRISTIGFFTLLFVVLGIKL